MSFQLHSFSTDTELVSHVSSRWLAWAGERLKRGVTATVALSGGRVAGAFFEAVSAQAAHDPAAVRAVEFFWGDERCVPPESADSNFLLAKTRLLEPVGVPPHKWHRVEGELPPPEAAGRAEAELRKFCPNVAHGMPVIDLVLLGMGEDGHVASLFPGAPQAVETSSAIFLPVIGPKPPPQRISLSYRALAAASEVWVLVAGAEKLQPLQRALSGACPFGLGRVLQERKVTELFESVGLANNSKRPSL